MNRSTSGRRIHVMTLFQPSTDINRHVRPVHPNVIPHWGRDGSAALILVATLIEQGFTLGSLLLDFPTNHPQGEAGIGGGGLDFGDQDLVVLTTRPPTDEPKERIGKSGSSLEQLVLGGVPTLFKMHERYLGFVPSLALADGSRGPGLLLSFGPDGPATLIWNWLLRRDKRELITKTVTSDRPVLYSASFEVNPWDDEVPIVLSTSATLTDLVHVSLPKSGEGGDTRRDSGLPI